MDLDDSTVTEPVETEAPGGAPAETVAAGGAPAAPETSSPASEGAAEPKTMLDAALEALNPPAEGKATEATDASAAVEDTATTPAEEDIQQGEAQQGVPILPDADFKALPKEARAAIRDLRAQVRNLQPQAERMAAVDRFMSQTGVTPDEYTQGHDVMALMKRDPGKALPLLEGYVRQVKQHLGMELGQDLRQEVEAGYITEQRAMDLSRARAEAANQRALADHARQQASQREGQAVRDAASAAVAAWEQGIRKSDADFERKLPLVMDKVRLATAGLGRNIRSTDEAVAIVQRAYGDVNQLMDSFRPARTATRPTPTSASSAPAQASPPKTLQEAALRSLGMA